MPYVNISSYLFVKLDDLESLQARLATRCDMLGLKGTILLATEGINLFLAGSRAAIDAILAWLRQDARFAQLVIQESLSTSLAFRHMLVRQKKETITMHVPWIRPAEQSAPAIHPKTLQDWLDCGHDQTGKEIVLLDVRNQFEVDIGTFSGAQSYGIKRFSEFPAAAAQHHRALQGKTVVSFCTGGIRCEKAALYMRALGLADVYQLQGGILHYFSAIGSAHYQGNCFVFDARTALTPELLPIAAAQTHNAHASSHKTQAALPVSSK
jgi:UPF0176 protein